MQRCHLLTGTGTSMHWKFCGHPNWWLQVKYSKWLHLWNVFFTGKHKAS